MLRLPFQKLKVWQKGMELAQRVYEASNKLPKEELYGLISQLRRSAVSVPSNLAEGSQRTSDKDFANFVLIAKGSLAELETQILLSEQLHYLSKSQAAPLINLIQELQKMLRALHETLTAIR